MIAPATTVDWEGWFDDNNNNDRHLWRSHYNRYWEDHSVFINSVDVGYSIAGAANVLHREKHATLIQLIIVPIKTAISPFWPISFCVFFVIAEFCKTVSVCQEVGWLDHYAKEEQFSRLDRFHHSCMTHRWAFIQCLCSKCSFQEEKAGGSREPLCGGHGITERGSGRRASGKGGDKIGFLKLRWVWNWLCTVGNLWLDLLST